MLKRFASELIGTSDIGLIIAPEDYDKVDADNYIMHEDQEKIFFIIKSKTDEYCFTNLALIHLDGATALSSKRTVKRYEYYIDTISAVSMETAGVVDLDAEIKFKLGEKNFSIDVDKKQIESLKDLYKTLVAIEKSQRGKSVRLSFAHKSLDIASNAVSSNKSEGSVSEEFSKIVEDSFDFLKACHDEFTQQDFSEFFEKYIN